MVDIVEMEGEVLSRSGCASQDSVTLKMSPRQSVLWGTRCVSTLASRVL